MNWRHLGQELQLLLQLVSLIVIQTYAGKLSYNDLLNGILVSLALDMLLRVLGKFFR